MQGDIVFDDDDVLAFNDVNPQAPVHVLIIPKRHISTLNDLTDGDEAIMGKLFSVAKTIAAQRGVSEDGYRLVVNCNQKAGQTVFHIHMHLLADRVMRWPPG
ncbi:MAG: histidine triad nucleotide-binding protein [Gammaproteobacteria bacterium]|nr:histidine triad nucleotide-binding protein [Gammaproteobacteria bacterium]